MNITKKIVILLALMCAWIGGMAQWEEPVSVNIKQEKRGDKEILLTFHLTIDPGWHVYSTDVGSGGPTPASFNVDQAKGIRPKGKLQTVGHAVRKMDPVFNMEVSFFEGSATFKQVLEITAKDYELKGYLEYGACNDRNCLPPTAVDVEVKGEAQALANQDNQADLANQTDQTDLANQSELSNNAGTKDSAFLSNQTDQTDLFISNSDSALWSSKVETLKTLSASTTLSGGNNAEAPNANRSLWWIFLMGVVGGLIAIITPCVWPIIPMTVSFFLKRAERQANETAGKNPAPISKGTPRRTSQGVKDALLYGASIVVIYVGLGLLITLLFGASALNSLSTNAIVNIFFCLLLVVFGLSFFGFFELELPSSWSNKADKKASSTTGLLSIFIMAFTLALVSFSCTGPIVGFLLVEVSTMGNIIGPLVGMLGFALALALPFTLFALFPQWMKKVKRGGSWMNTVKVILGFVEIAFALKFLSVADMAYGWHILPREVFIGVWIILAVMLGMYLVGLLRLPIDGPDDEDGGKRRIFRKRRGWEIGLGVVSLLFAAYMVPGFLGKPLPAISAFTPPMYTQHIHVLKGENVEADFRNYEEGMAYARKTGKKVLIDFTGFGCVNCREMEQKVWNDPEVAAKLKKDYVLISLFVDDREALPQHIKVEERGKAYTLRTVGDKWSYLQRHRFGANAQPFYVITSAEGEPLMPAYGFDTHVGHFMDFLNLKKE